MILRNDNSLFKYNILGLKYNYVMLYPSVSAFNLQTYVSAIGSLFIPPERAFTFEILDLT